jgi:hypothetical protein
LCPDRSGTRCTSPLTAGREAESRYQGASAP